MAAASNGARFGALIDRAVVAERIAARSAPLPERTATPPVDAGSGSGTVPLAFVIDQVDLGAVEAARAGLDRRAFLGRAVVDAARAVPTANGGSRDVHLGVDGRVVRDADRLRLVALAGAIATDADPDVEATIALVTTDANATVQPPVGTTAVVALGRIGVRPVARAAPDGEWAVALRPVADLTVAYDPGRLAGTGAAELLDHVRRSLEGRDWEAER